MSKMFTPRPLWVRVVSLAVGLPLLVVVHVVLAFFSVPSAEGGWLPTAAILLPFVLAILLGVGIGHRWWSTAAVALAISLMLGTWSYRTAPPEPERLDAVAAEVGTPEGWSTISATPGGSTWGLFGDFPRFDAVHATDEPAEEAAEQYGDLLEADGWERSPNPSSTSPPAGTIRQTWHHDRWVLTLTVVPPGSEWRRFDHQVPEDQTKVDIHLGY